ncbi:hypothetical protein PMAYCL1PPCAC_23420 [Pristionchus mayeri]|uniref:Uncharacterized protein n=1 Tax=Pristionchus mayeri TaxID=1317129 RepID=A0AAN5CZC7_9BILA|nr:hypothetical protein PMAYCL1PPCAC_23420 [Pristionchus mayeri]
MQPVVSCRGALFKSFGQSFRGLPCSSFSLRGTTRGTPLGPSMITVGSTVDAHGREGLRYLGCWFRCWCSLGLGSRSRFRRLWKRSLRGTASGIGFRLGRGGSRGGRPFLLVLVLFLRRFLLSVLRFLRSLTSLALLFLLFASSFRSSSRA